MRLPVLNSKMSNNILVKKQLNNVTHLIGIEAAHVVHNAKAGQFVMVRVDEKGERIPLTIYDVDAKQGIVFLIFQEVGKSTIKLGQLNRGDKISDIAGPLGEPSPIKNYGKVVCVAGGVGIAEIYPLARALKESGNYVITIVGVRNRELLILTDELSRVSDELHIATDDGSFGFHGFVTDVLRPMIGKQKVDIVFAVGPIPMMSAVARLTKPKIKTIVSLNSIMVDGTGMCGSCRVSVGGETKFVCVDGPDFDAHMVDFDELSSRQNRFKDFEKESLEVYRKHVKCHK
ncbi:MAG: sulfide/dihydroorotate dehydrogenase-like FAD/NAD-binding protein [Candidatus Omnitrophota bacterium]